MIRRASAPTPRRGYVLYIVLVVVVVLTLVAYQYYDAMGSEASAAVRAHELDQAKANAVSGVYYACAILTDPNFATVNLDDDSKFSALPVGTGNAESDQTSVRWQGDVNKRRGGGLVSLINLSDITGGTDGTYPGGLRRYGLEDESRKLNVNALIRLDPTGSVLFNALMQLPNMTSDIAGAIVDWVDPDDTEYPSGGAESAYYTGGGTPYRCKNGPIHSVEELLLVKGVTPDLLFGADRNRNGVQDANETANGSFTRGWSEYLTCYGREVNVDGTGVARVNLNSDDLATLDGQLMGIDGMTREVADYILYYRISGTGETFTPTLAAGRVSAPVSDLRSLVQSAVDNGSPPRRKLTSPFTVLNTQIRLPAKAGGSVGSASIGPGGGGVVVVQQQQVTPVVACPLNDTATLQAVAKALVDRCTASDDYEMVPRINVNTAPREVLNCLKGMNSDTSTQLTDSDIDAILSNRPTAGTDQTSAWLVTSAGLTPAKYKNIEKYITGRSGAYRVRSVGYFGTPGGPQASAEAVIEVVAEDPDGTGAVAKPRIVWFRDTTDMGRVFDDLPR